MTHTVPSQHTSSRARMRGLVATLALLAFVAGVPAVLVAIGAVPDLSAFSWSRLTQPDDGTLVLAVLTGVCWVAWTIFTGQLLASIAGQIRGTRTPRLPGLIVPQLAADRLVAAAALLFVAVPSAAALLPQPPAEATMMTAAPPAATPAGAHAPDSATPQVASPTLVGDSGTHAQDARSVPTRPAPAQADTDVERYTVKRGDSLWRIAEERLGDGARYVELVELNRSVLDGRPDFLLPGTVLRVPVSAPLSGAVSDPHRDAGSNATQAYVVEPGDTLSAIAENEYGDADAYPEIFDASRDSAQPDGRQLTDPDLILPGWKLTIPGEERSDAPPGPRHVEPDHHDTGLNNTAPTHPPGAPTTLTPHDPTPSQVAPSEVTDEQTTLPHVSVDDRNDTTGPSWLVPGLAGAGSILGGALYLALRAKRRTQLRYRRPGTVITPPPIELLPVEKTARATASTLAPQIDLLDTALRALPQHPPVLTAALDQTAIALTLREPADLPPPWAGSGTAWRIGLTDVPDLPEDSFPPYPLLASVGREPDGAFAFLNLEELRTVAVTGDPQRAQALARHLAAELAVNPWSSVTTVDLLGLGVDLASFNLGRVRTHPACDTEFITDLTHALSSLTEPADPDDFYAAIIATADRPASDMARLTEVIASIPGRSSATIIDLAGDPQVAGAHLEVTADGRLREASLGLDVAAAGLSEEEARACALLLDLTLDATTESVPVPSSIDGVDVVCDLGGALVQDLTEPRPDRARSEASLLPLEAHVYADAAATTIEDVEVLAPQATPQARAAVVAADPDLDEDLARWESPTLTSAKLILLGPVGARTTGDAKATAHRRPFYVELLAFLALHPRGVSAAHVADAFSLKPERVRVDISQLRRWLGNDPRAGEPYLPKAEPGTGPDSPALYTVRGVLSDLDLFRRLRARGQSRGAKGIDDLISALRLVSGEPFTQLREGHWNWLLDGERWDHIMSAAIVDVGHIVTTHALAAGDRALALWAAQVSYGASPFDEVAQLDIIAAEKAHGDGERAEQHLSERVLNRRDDDLAPIDVPSRSAQVIDNKKWRNSGSRSRRTN
jgi:nucleoid-associated protein YgaU